VPFHLGNTLLPRFTSWAEFKSSDSYNRIFLSRGQIMTSNRVRSGTASRRLTMMDRIRRKGAGVVGVVIAAFALMIFSPALLAQTSAGAISGSVLDPQGRPIAGAAVTVTNIETGVVQVRQSSSAGSYRVDALNPGKYSVSAAESGFKRAII